VRVDHGANGKADAMVERAAVAKKKVFMLDDRTSRRLVVDASVVGVENSEVCGNYPVFIPLLSQLCDRCPLPAVP